MSKQQAIDLLNQLSFRLSDIKPADYAEQNRIMTGDVSAFKGPFSFKRSPYMREPVNRLSQDDPCRIIGFMGGSQIGKTASLIENAICWAIANNPGPMWYASGSKEFSIETTEKRIDAAIDGFGIRNLIRPNTVRKTNKRSGDTTKSKEFAGGWLRVSGLSNPDELRSWSLMYGFIDEVDTQDLSDKKEGSFRMLFENRFTQYYSKMKLVYLSTPTIKGQSNIENIFLAGDQRVYKLPCPKCGEFIEIKWREKMDSGEFAGIHFELDGKGLLKKKSIGYICQECGGFWYEKDKYDLLEEELGIWHPTATPIDEGITSYTAPSLLAPIGAYNWEHYIKNFLQCYPQGLTNSADTSLLKVFVNTCLAQPYEERGRTTSANQLSKNTRNYKMGTVPMSLSEQDGNGIIVLLTCAIDMNGTEDDARLDYEVVGHSESGTTYSIEHGSIGTFQRGFEKKKDDERKRYTYRNNEPNNVWDELYTNVLSKVYPTDKNGKMFVFAVAIDYGFLGETVISFISKYGDNPVPVFWCMVKGSEEKVKKYNVDSANYHKSKEVPNLYLLESNQLKDSLADKMELKWSEETGFTQPAGFMNFPEPEAGHYTVKDFFSQFESEHKVEQLNNDGTAIGYIWKKKHSTVRNHFFDCRYYNLAVRDILRDIICKESKITEPTWDKFCKLIIKKPAN